MQETALTPPATIDSLQKSVKVKDEFHRFAGNSSMSVTDSQGVEAFPRRRVSKLAAEPVADNIQIMSGWRSFFIAILVLGSFTQQTIAQTTGALCPNPRARCTSTYSFASYQLPFVIKENLVFGKTYKSTAFYAIVLKSVRSSADSDCKFIAEDERDAAQSQFPASKVFTSRHSCPEELVLYENVDPNLNFMAVYAGATAATAKRMLNRVRASGRYPQAYIKQFRVVLEYLT